MSKYSNALKVLNDQDMKRLACCFFHADLNKVDWSAAAADFGSASANSFRTMIYSSQKKVRDYEAKLATDDTPAASTKAIPKPTFKTTPKPHKRKAKAAVDEDKVDEGYGELQGSYETVPASKKSHPAGKKMKQERLGALIPEQLQDVTKSVWEETGVKEEGEEGGKEGVEEQELVMEHGHW